MSDKLASPEMDEFSGRDEVGLQPIGKAQHKTEAEARAFYFRMVFGLATFWDPLLASVFYLALGFLLPEQGAMYQAKFTFIRDYQLGYVYAAWFLAQFAATYGVVNANGARAAARLDRPDQHIYKIMSESGPLAGAPYVLMANTGAAGRFNRAQRAFANISDGLPRFLTGLMLQGAVFGPVALALAVLYLSGACMFAESYKEHSKARLSGFLILTLAENLSLGFVAVVAFQTTLRPLLPF